MTDVPTPLQPILADLLLAAADDKLLLGHRNSEWTGLGPILEEDIAFSSLAQDEMAHAMALYEAAGPFAERSPDQLAFGRSLEDYRSAAIVELPDDFNWAVAIARQLFCDHFDLLRLSRLAHSCHEPIAALAKRLVAEERVHVEHVDDWIRRLGRGTTESQRRMQVGLDLLAGTAPMLFETVADEAALVEAGLYPPLAPADGGDDMFKTWADRLHGIAADAGLDLALTPPPPGAVGGRRGRHTEHLAPLLEEMCEVFRLAPDAAW